MYPIQSIVRQFTAALCLVLVASAQAQPKPADLAAIPVEELTPEQAVELFKTLPAPIIGVEIALAPGLPAPGKRKIFQPQLPGLGRCMSLHKELGIKILHLQPRWRGYRQIANIDTAPHRCHLPLLHIDPDLAIAGQGIQMQRWREICGHNFGIIGLRHQHIHPPGQIGDTAPAQFGGNTQRPDYPLLPHIQMQKMLIAAILETHATAFKQTGTTIGTLQAQLQIAERQVAHPRHQIQYLIRAEADLAAALKSQQLPATIAALHQG